MGKKTRSKKVAQPLPDLPADVPDDDLVDDLLAQLDSRDATVQQESAKLVQSMELVKDVEPIESASKQDSKTRYRARQARKAEALVQSYGAYDAAADARIQKEAEDEERDIKAMCDQLGVEIHEINPDGHCLFSAIADQLRLLSILPSAQASYATARAAAATYIYTHPDDFLPFLPSTAGEDGAGAGDSGLMSPKQFEQYCASIRDTAIWGGEPEILALSRVYNVPIHVVQSGKPPVVIHTPTGTHSEDISDARAVRISYHRRMYGLGEHYNSLRPKSKRTQVSDALHGLISLS